MHRDVASSGHRFSMGSGILILAFAPPQTVPVSSLEFWLFQHDFLASCPLPWTARSQLSYLLAPERLAIQVHVPSP